MATGTIAGKKKINKADYEFKQRDGEELMKKPGDIDGLAFRMMDLKNCTVYLLDHIAQVRIFPACNHFWTIDYD